MAVYNFTKSNIDIDRLSSEISASVISSAEYQYATFNSPNLSLVFDGELSSGDQNTLSSLIDNHSGVPVYEPPGRFLISDGSGAVNFMDMSSTQFDVSVPGAYGESESETATTSTNFQRKLRLTTELDSGDYTILWYYEWRYKNSAFNFKSRIQINDETTIMEHNQRPVETDSWAPASGFKRITLASGTHNIDLDYCSSKSNKEARIRRARLGIWGL